MQSAAAGIVFVGELPAGMQRGEDDFEGRLLELLVRVDRDAASVVLDGDRGAVLVERHLDGVALAGEELIDRVVDDLPDEVMQPARVDPADIHRGPSPYGIEAFEDLNVVGSVGLGIRCHWSWQRQAWGVIRDGKRRDSMRPSPIERHWTRPRSSPTASSSRGAGSPIGCGDPEGIICGGR